MTNWFDPDANAVRGILILVALASLLMAIAIPDAFGERAVMFAASYAGLQILRNAFAAFASPSGSVHRENFVRILSWSVAVGVLWLVGAFLPGDARVAVWVIALVLDYSGPYAGYWVPGIGRVGTEAWRVDASHFAERFQLFVIIVLGESIVVTGLTASELDLHASTVGAIAVAFLGSAALWWLYFDYVARIARCA